MFAFAAVCGVALVPLVMFMRRLQGQKPKFQKNYNHDNGRPLGIMEELLRHVHDTTGSLILADTLVLRSQKEITGSVVRKAMELLMRRHSNLRMCYQKNQNGEKRLKCKDFPRSFPTSSFSGFTKTLEPRLLEHF